MSKEEFIAKVKENLRIDDDSRDLMISDFLQDVLNYTNLIELPIELESFIRKKIKDMIDYEIENGTDSVFDVKSIKEGDTNITYNTEDVSKSTVYGLSKDDKKRLQEFRRRRR